MPKPSHESHIRANTVKKGGKEGSRVHEQEGDLARVTIVPRRREPGPRMTSQVHGIVPVPHGGLCPRGELAGRHVLIRPSRLTP